VRTIGTLIALPFIAALGSPAQGEGRTINTVRGQLTVSCAPTKGKFDGNYQYMLTGKRIAALSSECSPEMSTSYIDIDQVLRSKANTTILILEGLSAASQNVRVLYIPLKGPAYSVQQLGGDGQALVQKSPTSFRLISPGGGFALSDRRKSTWTCVIDIDFAGGTVSGDLAVPFEPGLPRSVCDAEIRRVAL
jgi:hypothetical protein